MAIVDGLMAKYGFRWDTAPYRIVDDSTGLVVSTGPGFDLTESALISARNATDRKTKSHFK